MNYTREYIRRWRDGQQRAWGGDTRMIGALLALLQFAGGWYLFAPFARLMPPFYKLFEALPAWTWALYFIVSGLAGAISVGLPDSNQYLRTRFLVALWIFCNWCFLSTTTALTLAYLLKHPNEGVIYGMTLAFYPILTFAAWWKCKRLRFEFNRATEEKEDEARHVENLKARARNCSRTRDISRLTDTVTGGAKGELCG